MNNYFLLFIEFFKIGLFTFGGGYASLPFLYEIIDKYNWFTQEQLTQLIAISGLTPGPVGLNMATFAGFKTLELKGAILASFALILPMLIITSQIFKLYKKFSKNKCMQKILYILRPTSCALITSVGIKLFNDLIIKKSDMAGFVLILLLLILTFKIKKEPLIYIGICAFFGAGLYLLKT